MPDAAQRRDVKTAPRRDVRLRSLGDLASELDRLEDAFNKGTLTHTGNHPPGAIIKHLAEAIRGSFEGIPDFGVPAPVRWAASLFKPFVLRRPLGPGMKLKPGVEKAVWDDGAEFRPSLKALREQLERLERAEPGPSQPHPLLGRFSAEDWRRFHLLHAQMHLSFLDPGV